jgi:flagellar M-ring protein FliF
LNDMKELWQRLTPARRWGLATTAVLVLVAMALMARWALRTEYEVLFTDLAARDGATIVSELDKAKVSYQLRDGGATILVPAESVHATRLKLMSKDVALQAGIGFELFNANDVGVTDFAQKVNFQRALQGELVRTILSLEGVQSARVHLVLSDQGLFRKANDHAKASVTVAMRSGHRLDKAQIRGIQRLVAAAVAEVRPDEVTVLDQRGTALSRNDGDSLESAESLADGKRELEEYLSRKVTDVLEQSFGERQAIVRVDAVVNLEQSKVTTESVLPSVGINGAPAGVLIREQVSNPSQPAPSASEPAPVSTARNREVQYQVGRRVEQTVSRPGSTLSRLNVAVVVRTNLEPAQLDKLRELVGATVGLNRARGDVLAVYAMDQIGGQASVAPPALGTLEAAETVLSRTEDRKSAFGGSGANADPVAMTPWGVLLMMVLLILALAASAYQARRVRSRHATPQVSSDQQRQRLLESVRGWLNETPRQDDREIAR